jgi:4-amino-4-deoxy-L-arabinose transferase-like glycosyltransferase
MKRWLDAAIVATAAAATNFWYYLACAPDWYFPDSYTYLIPARNLLRGLGFVTEPDLPETLRTPGYPLILAAFGAHDDPVIFAQHLANVLIAIGIYFIARRYTNRFTALAAGLIFAIDVPTMHYANKILSETFFTALLFVAFAVIVKAGCPVAGLPGSPRGNSATWKPGNLIATATLCGSLVLIRPVAIAFFLIPALLHRRRLVLFVVLANVLPLAWAARNWRETEVFTVSSIGDVNLLSWRAAGVLALERGGDFKQAIAVEQQRLDAIVEKEILEEEEVTTIDDVDPAVRAQYHGALGRRILLQHPFRTIQLTLRGVIVNIFDSRWDALLEPLDDDTPQAPLRIAVTAWTIALFVLAAIGTFALWRRNRHFALAVAATFAYFILVSAGGESESRFRVPVVPQYAIAAGAGVDLIRRRLATRSG